MYAVIFCGGKQHKGSEGDVLSVELLDAGEKIKIVKFRRRKHHQKVTGHRQWYTDLEITGISE